MCSIYGFSDCCSKHYKGYRYRCHINHHQQYPQCNNQVDEIPRDSTEPNIILYIIIIIVKVINIFYNKEIGISFCLLDGPSREAIEKHHEKYDVKCEWITEVQTTG